MRREGGKNQAGEEKRGEENDAAEKQGKEWIVSDSSAGKKKGRKHV